MEPLESPTRAARRVAVEGPCRRSRPSRRTRRGCARARSRGGSRTRTFSAGGVLRAGVPGRRVADLSAGHALRSGLVVGHGNEPTTAKTLCKDTCKVSWRCKVFLRRAERQWPLPSPEASAAATTPGGRPGAYVSTRRPGPDPVILLDPLTPLDPRSRGGGEGFDMHGLEHGQLAEQVGPVAAARARCRAAGRPTRPAPRRRRR